MYGMGEPVKISNTVYMPMEDEETGEEISAEEVAKREAEKAEEKRIREAEEKLEMERRINEEAEAKLKQFLVRRSESLEKERTEIIEAAKKEANALAADAKATTMSVIKKAETECIKLKEEARREGHEQGYAEGRTESLEKYKKYIDAAGQLLEEINSRKEAYYISYEEEMRETIFEMVHKVIGEALKADPQIIDGIIGEAAKNFRNSDYIKITLADDEISERFITDKKLMRDIIPYIPEIEIEFDDEAEEGTVIIDDGAEIVDASIPTQLDFLKEILRNTRGEATEEEEEFMEEIKGRAHRRKSVTIGAGSEAAEEIQPRVPKAAGAVETEAARAETAAEMETAAEEPVAEAVEAAAEAAEAEPVAEAPKPKTRSRKKAPAVEPEPVKTASEPLIDMSEVAAEELALAEAMAFVETAAEDMPDVDAVLETAGMTESEALEQLGLDT